MSEAVARADVESAARGDRQAFARLIERTRALVTSLALAVVRDVPASEDIAQDVYLAVWRDLRTLRNPESFMPWLRQLTRRRSLDAVRGAGRRAMRPGPRPGDEIAANVGDPRPDAAAQLISETERIALEQALEELPAEGRELIALFYREGRSVQQVAALLDLGESAVKKRLQRARDGLREATLARLGELLERTAPTAAFTAAVLGGIAVSAPSTAAAAGLGAKGAGAVGLGSLLAASAFGAALGVMGVFGSVGRIARHARDERERDELRRFTRTHAVATAVAALVMPLAGLLLAGAGLIASFALFYAFTAHGTFVVLPRICADPVSAELTRALRRARVTLVAGGLLAAATVAWLTWQIGLVP